MEYPLWSLLPFVAMLASIAVLPLIPATSHWWERNSSQLTVALVLAVPTTLWMFWKAGSGPLIDTGIEYFQFICLLLSLYVVSGGIHLAGDIRATRGTIRFSWQLAASWHPSLEQPAQQCC